MADELVGFKLQINGQEKVVKSLGEMRQLLKEANFELLSAQQNFGEYSNEAINAAKNVANLKDSLQEAGETAQLFDPGKKFQAFAGALSAAAGGISAFQGALGLLGTESENVQKTLVKVQSALALSQGLSTIADSAKDFQRLAAVIQSTTVYQKAYNFVLYGTTNAQKALQASTVATSTAMRVLRGVMASIGIGALIFGVTTLISKIMEWTDRASENEKALKKQADATKILNQDIDNEIALLTALGGQEEKIAEKRKEQINNNLKDLQDRLKKVGKLTQEEQAEYRKLATEIKVIDINEANRKKKEQEDAAKERKEQNKQALEDFKKLKEEEAAEEERRLESRRALLVYNRDELRKFQKEQADEERQKRQEQEAEDAINSRRNLAQQITNAQELQKALSTLLNQNTQNARDQYAALLNFEITSGNLSYQEQEKRFQQIRQLERQKLIDRKATQAEFDLFDKESKEQEKKRDQEAAAVKAQVISGALGAIADAVGRNTVAGKALSIAQATVDTYAGANKALATYPPPFGAIAAGTVILAGLLNVKKILSTKIPPPPGAKGVSDNTTAPAAATVSTPAPINPTQQLQASSTLLNAQAIQQLGSATNRSYVLESDVTNSQERIRRINRAARLS